MIEHSIYRKFDEDREKKKKSIGRLYYGNQKKHHAWEYWIPGYGICKLIRNCPTHIDENGILLKGGWLKDDVDSIYYRMVDNDNNDNYFGLRKPIENVEDFLFRTFRPTKVRPIKVEENDCINDLLNPAIAAIIWGTSQTAALYGVFQLLLAK